MVSLFRSDALISALRQADKPIAVLVGSPLSIDFSGRGRGVPGTDGVVGLAHEMLRNLDVELEHRLTAAIDGAVGATAYQRALEFLHGNTSQRRVNELVVAAVASASKNASVIRGTGIIDDTDPDDWWLPNGAVELGALIAACADRFGGPILTTNFDPLIEVGLRAAGRATVRAVVDSDGSLPRDSEEEPGRTRVVYLHGYWRGSDTLHSHSQLVGPRPRLTASLKSLLQKHTLLVVGYGGWDDVFTSVLADLSDDPLSDLDVLWCFRETDEAIIAARNAALMDKVSGAITRGRFRGYSGIDVQSIFGEIERALTKVSPPRRRPSSPLTAWQLVTSQDLAEMPPLDDGELLAFFDGQVPTWRHAVCQRIPQRSSVDSVVQRLDTAAGHNQMSFDLIIGASGEGKSTLLLQAAARLVGNGGFSLLWRPEPGIPLDPDEVARLPKIGRTWLLVSDDADEIAHELSVSLARAHQRGRSDLAVLVSSRDTDWVAADGFLKPWRTYATVADAPLRLGGVDKTDAAQIVDAWSQLGGDGLGALSSVAANDRAAALLLAVDSQPLGQRSLFGGMLEVRFGEAGLREHLISLLQHLGQQPIDGSTLSLSDALMYIACCHGPGMDGIDETVLADLLTVDRDTVFRCVVRRLGDEAAAVRGARHVYTRHRRVAEALLVVAVEQHLYDLPELWASLVRQTIATTRTARVGQQSHAAIVHAGKDLVDRLPQQIGRQIRLHTAEAACRAAIDAEPDRVSFVVDLATLYRRTDRSDQAVIILRAYATSVASSIDWQVGGRSFFYEWGVCAGNIGDAKLNIWLATLSLSDQISTHQPSQRNAALALSGLGTAYRSANDIAPFEGAAEARSAAAFLGLRSEPDDRGREILLRQQRETLRDGAKEPVDVEAALNSLATVAGALRGEVAGALPAVAAPPKLSLTKLGKLYHEKA